jgi:hypothetical protein
MHHVDDSDEGERATPRGTGEREAQVANKGGGQHSGEGSTAE